MGDEVAAAFGAGGQLQHVGVEEADQEPGAGDAQLGFALEISIVQVQAVAFDQASTPLTLAFLTMYWWMSMNREEWMLAPASS